ncbi:MAG: suppressor of fused domain protein [Flavobacteriales bacterium]
MTQEEYKKQFSEDDAVGWMAIDEQLKTVYGDTEPRHFGSLIKYMMGGEDPIDGTSIYDSEKQEFHRHFVSYGMSELYYNEEKAGGEFSRWGFEFTFRLKPFEGDDENPTWVISMMNNLARYVFNSGNWFEVNHFVPANGPIRLDTETDIVGLVFAEDPELGRIQTPHGEVIFLQMVGITSAELEHLKENPTLGAVEELINELKKDNPLLITDLNRK